jgi:hypothetical protein
VTPRLTIARPLPGSCSMAINPRLSASLMAVRVLALPIGARRRAAPPHKCTASRLRAPLPRLCARYCKERPPPPRRIREYRAPTALQASALRLRNHHLGAEPRYRLGAGAADAAARADHDRNFVAEIEWRRHV